MVDDFTRTHHLLNLNMNMKGYSTTHRTKPNAEGVHLLLVFSCYLDAGGFCWAGAS